MYTFKVEDITCSCCATSITETVSRVPGVSEVTVDSETKGVVVKGAAGVSRDEVIAAINEAGYSEITLVEEGKSTIG